MPFVSRYAGMTPDEIEASLYEEISAALQRRYSLLPDADILRRVREEWTALRSSGTLLDAAALYELTLWLRERKLPFWLCGDLRVQLSLYLLGMTAGNPLPPHYYCPQCRQVRWAEHWADGFDLPENQACGEDGAPLSGDGHGVPWQTLWSGGPEPDCVYEIRLASPAYEELTPDLKEHWLLRLKPDAELSEPYPSVHVVKFSGLSLMFTIDPKDVSPDFFLAEADASYAAAALLDSGTLIDPDGDGGSAAIPPPDCFADLVYACGLCHSTGTWDEGAEFMARQMGYGLRDLVAFRDDVFSYLLAHGFSEEEARQGMAQARRGRGFPKVTGEMKAARDKWVLARCANVQYLFPKAHAVEWILYRLRAAGVRNRAVTSYALFRRALSGAGVYLLAGSPGMGKTAFAQYLAGKLAGEDRKRVAVFAGTTFQEAEGVSVYSGGDLDAVEARMRAGADFVVIDPLRQLLRRKRINAAQVSAVMERLRELALNTGIPILVTAGLTRNPERRRNHRPRMTDVPLAEGLLPCTEAVLLLYREGYFEPGTDRAQCEIWKYPGSVLRTVRLVWDQERGAFGDGTDLRSEG